MKFLKSIFQKPVTILIMVVVVLVYGVYATLSMSLNLVPDIGFPVIGVTVTYVGADAEVIEKEVTDVIYTGLSSLEDVHSVSSYSLNSVSISTVEFDYGTDLEKKESVIKEKIEALELPSECSEPSFVTLDLNGDAVASVSIYSSEDDFDTVYEEALQLKNKLSGISGVGSVEVIGAQDNSVEIKMVNGLEQFSLLIVQELANSSYDIPLGSILQDGDKISVNNSSFPGTLEDLKKTPVSLSLSSTYLSLFSSVQTMLNELEDVTTTDLDSYKVDIDKVLDFIDLLETSSYEDLDDMSSSISAVNAIIYLEENYSASTLDYLWKSTLKDIVEDEDFRNLSDEELEDMADDINVSYDLLKWMRDNSDTMEDKWAMLVEFRKNHPTEDGEEIPNEEYIPLFYDLEIFSPYDQDDNYLSEEDMLDVIELSRNINTVSLTSIVDTLENEVDYEKEFSLLNTAKAWMKVYAQEEKTIQENFDRLKPTLLDETFLTMSEDEIRALSESTGFDTDILFWMQKNDSIDKVKKTTSLEEMVTDLLELKSQTDIETSDIRDFFYDNDIFVTDSSEDNYASSSHLDAIIENYEKLNSAALTTLLQDGESYLPNNTVRQISEDLVFLQDLRTMEYHFPVLEDATFGGTIGNSTYHERELLSEETGVPLSVLSFLKEAQNDGKDPQEVYAVLSGITEDSFVHDLYSCGYYSSDEGEENYISEELLNRMTSYLQKEDASATSDYLDAVLDDATPGNSAYAALFNGTSYDESGVINATTIGYIRSRYFEDNWNSLYSYKQMHQHLETTLDEEGNVTEVYVGEDLTSEEMMELYDSFLFEEEPELKLTSRLIDFVRDSDFSSSTFVTTIEEIADVNESTSYSDVAYLNGVKCIQLDLYANSGANSTSISKDAKAILKDYVSPNHSQAILISDQSQFISDSVSNAVVSLIIGAVLAVIVIYVFLRKIGSSLVIAITMPLSVLMSLICLNWMGITLNMVSVGGLAVGIGMLVDNSIVVLESISSEREKGMTALEASVSGVKLVLGSLFGSTITSICVFFPILLMKGLTREIFADLAWAVIYSLSFSLLFAVLVIPTLYCLFYSKGKYARETSEGKVVKKMKEHYGKILNAILHHRALTLVLALCVFGGSIGLLFTTDTEFLPSCENGIVNVTLDYTTTDTVDYCESTCKEVSDYLSAVYSEDIDYIAFDVSKGGFTSTDLQGTITIQLDSKAPKSVQFAEDVRESLHDQAQFENLSYSVQAIDGVVASLTSGYSSTGISITGEDVDTLGKIAAEVEEKLLTEYSDSFKKVTDNLSDKTTQYTISVDEEKCYELGVDYTNLITSLRVGISGYTACTLNENDVIVSFTDDAFSSYYDGIENYMAGVSSSGEIIRLKDVASITSREARNMIRKSAGKNVLSVSAETYGITTGTASKIFNKVAKEVLSNPEYEGYEFASSGISSYLSDAFEGLVKALIISFFLLVAVLACLFESFRKPFIVLFSFPLAFTGAFVALAMTRMTLNVVSFIGLIMLMGVIVNDAIVLIERISQLKDDDHLAPYEAIMEGCKGRLRAVLMTTVTTILGIFPMALGLGDGGALMQPLGIVVIGGMTLGTAVTLGIIPTVYSLVYRISPPDVRNKKKERAMLPVSEGVSVTAPSQEVKEESVPEESDNKNCPSSEENEAKIQ